MPGSPLRVAPHADLPTPPESGEAVRGGQSVRAPRALSPAREAGRRTASRLLRAASAVCSLRQVAVAWGLSPRSGRVEDLADEHHEAAVTLGDLLAAPPRFAETVLVAALAHVRARRVDSAAQLRPELRALRLAGLAGEVAALVATALADGTIDKAEADELLRALGRLDHETVAATRDLGAPEGR